MKNFSQTYKLENLSTFLSTQPPGIAAPPDMVAIWFSANIPVKRLPVMPPTP